jgi:hypothetical protein
VTGVVRIARSFRAPQARRGVGAQLETGFKRFRQLETGFKRFRGFVQESDASAEDGRSCEATQLSQSVASTEKILRYIGAGSTPPRRKTQGRHQFFVDEHLLPRSLRSRQRSKPTDQTHRKVLGRAHAPPQLSRTDTPISTADLCRSDSGTSPTVRAETHASPPLRQARASPPRSPSPHLHPRPHPHPHPHPHPNPLP